MSSVLRLGQILKINVALFFVIALRSLEFLRHLGIFKCCSFSDYNLMTFEDVTRGNAYVGPGDVGHQELLQPICASTGEPSTVSRRSSNPPPLVKKRFIE